MFIKQRKKERYSYLYIYEILNMKSRRNDELTFTCIQQQCSQTEECQQ